MVMPYSHIPQRHLDRDDKKLEDQLTELEVTEPILFVKDYAELWAEVCADSSAVPYEQGDIESTKAPTTQTSKDAQ